MDRLLDEVAAIGQPSIQWHVAQMLQRLRRDLSDEQVRRATALLQRNLTRSTDWIVLNTTIDVLAEWAAHDPELARWVAPELERLRRDPRKSVAKRATMRLSELAGRVRPRSGGRGRP